MKPYVFSYKVAVSRGRVECDARNVVFSLEGLLIFGRVGSNVTRFLVLVE